MPQADTEHTLFREHFCKFSAVGRLHFRDMWVQFTVIDGELWFRDWHVIDALGPLNNSYAERLLRLLHPNDCCVVLTDRGPHLEEREIGGFVSWAGARRMAAAVRSQVRRERFVSWLNGKLRPSEQTSEFRDGWAGKAAASVSPVAARGSAFLPLP